jgi:tRNA dimethylallyltransferase
MDIGSAKPSMEERARVPHHMIDIRNPDEGFSAGEYVKEARVCIESILNRGKIPMVVGGTGLYIRALLGGILDLPPSDPDIRRSLIEEEQQGGPATLYERLQGIDPATARTTPPQNLSRIIRTLEVFRITGKRISDLQQEHGFRSRPYRSLFICLSLERKILYERIDMRVDCMINGGLMEEVERLVQRGYSLKLNSLQSLGYRHAALILAGDLDHHEAIRLMKRDTRRYAKRQLTWFRSEPGALWMSPNDMNNIECLVDHFLSRRKGMEDFPPEQGGRCAMLTQESGD